MSARSRVWTLALLGAALVSAATARALELYQGGDPGRFEALPIRSVRVGGVLEHVSRRELERAIAPHLAAGFFGVDIRAVARAARTLPWVASVSVRRVWPDSLNVAVIEREAVARWGDGALVAADGTVFEPERTGPVGRLPRLSGPPGSARQLLGTLREVSGLLDGVGGGVAGLSLSPRGIWRVACANGVEIVLREGQLPRLAELARLYEPLLGSRAQSVSRIDLRYTNGFAVRWTEEPKGNQG